MKQTPKPNKAVDELKRQVAELTEALQRERADALNVKRRADEDRSRMADFYKVMIMRDFLPALDNLERAISHEPVVSSPERRNSRLATTDSRLKTWEDWANGVESIGTQFEKVFVKLGIERIKTVGEHFDPKLHEAVSVEDAGGQVEIVCEELQPGYKLGDDIIRHALVKVKREKK